MADINQIISLGIGTPADVPHFLLVGLSTNENPVTIEGMTIAAVAVAYPSLAALAVTHPAGAGVTVAYPEMATLTIDIP